MFPINAQFMGFLGTVRRREVLAVIAAVGLIALNFVSCLYSPMSFMDEVLQESDMLANIKWAAGIHEQGWLNPRPHHLYSGNMALVAPYEQWVRWWGGEAIFQQSPLYAYVLALTYPNLVAARLLQAVFFLLTAVFIGLTAARLGDRVAGWAAFAMAASFAPFHAYFWPLLRDGLAWLISAALLFALVEVTAIDWRGRRVRNFGCAIGVLLGLGLLARETYYLILPVILAGLLILGRRNGNIKPALYAGVFAAIMIAPLVARNYLVDAPLLSSSNRFSETFIHGNAPSARPNVIVVNPKEVLGIMSGSEGRPLETALITIHSHPDGIAGWARLQLRKLLSLLDPYEPPDNISIYFIAEISPVVKWGLPYWILIVPGLIGFAVAVAERRRGIWWVAVLMTILVASILIGAPVSRYRQSLMVFLIPCAAFLVTVIGREAARRNLVRVGALVLAVGVGWALVKGPLATFPLDLYERPLEYRCAVEIYEALDLPEQAEGIRQKMREKFTQPLDYYWR